MKKRVFCLCICTLLFLSGCNFINGGSDDEVSSTNEAGSSSEVESVSEVDLQPDTSMYEGMSDEEKLAAVGTWEKELHPQNLMVFHEDGSGEITNYDIVFRMEWSLENDVLSTDVEIYNQMYNTKYDFIMEGNSYVITSHETQVSARFYIGGTQATGLPSGGEKDPVLIGKWIPEDSSFPGYIFAGEGEVSGRFSVRDEEQDIQRELEWTVFDYELYVYYVNGPQYVYEYMLSGNNLVLYREGESNIVYRRAE